MNTEKYRRFARLVAVTGSGAVLMSLGLLITICVIIPGVIGLYGLRGMRSWYVQKSYSKKSK